MLNDSLDVGVLAENVRLLQKEIKEAGSELPTPGEGDTGKIIKVGSEGYELAEEYSYTPPSYSTLTETDTGRDWIDGKDIYEKVFTGELSETDTTLSVSYESIVMITGTRKNVTNGNIFDINKNLNIHAENGTSIVITGNVTYAGNEYELIVWYTKPDPVPSNETRKTTKKK